MTLTLRKKTLLIVTLTLIALVIGLFFGIRTIVMGSIEELEDRDVQKQVQRVNEALDDRWAAMDEKLRVEGTPGRVSDRERYAAALDNEATKVRLTRQNKLADFIADLNMNLFMFSYAPDNIRWGQGLDEATGEITPIPESLGPHLTPDSPLLNPPADGSSLMGLVMLPEGPMLVVSVGILAQEGEGGSIHEDAAMIMGRYLDKDEIDKLAQQTRLTLNVTRFDEVTDPEVLSVVARSPLSETTREQVHVIPLDSDIVEGHTVLADISGNPALALRVDIPRDVMDEGKKTLNLLLYALIAVGVILVVLIAWLLDRLVLSRMASLNSQVSGISMASALDSRVTIPGNDELSNLGGAINGMLGEIQTERGRSENLLLNVLPQPIADRLKGGETVIADSFGDVTVLFSDVVSFTKLSARIWATDLVDMLNWVFSAFDSLTDRYGLEKIKTIGDAYMVCGGLPEPREDHAEAIAKMSLDMYAELDRINREHGTDLNIRIGINTGSVVAGVIGTKKFIYDLWGDAVNTAARMESHGVEGRVQLSEETYVLLKDKFNFEDRGIIDVKGKGDMHVYLLEGSKVPAGEPATAMGADADS